MTTFNLTRSNDNTNLNTVLIGIVIATIVALVVVFAPALFTTTAVTVNGSPYNFNNPEGGNFVSTTLDNRIDGLGGVDSAVYFGKDGWVVVGISDSQGVNGSDVGGGCGGNFVVPANAPDLGGGNFFLGQVGSTTIIYSTDAGLIFFISNGVVVTFDPVTCTAYEKLLAG